MSPLRCAPRRASRAALVSLVFAPFFGALALTAACSEVEREPLPFEPAGPSAAPDPSALGPYPVGVRTVTMVNPRRVKTSTVDGSRTPRTLVVEVWYPVKEAARTAAPYTYGAADIVPAEIAAKISGESVKLATSAVRDAAPRSDDAPYPMVMFSHGNGGVRMQLTYFTVTLASHGYVVVAPDHTGDTLADFIANGGLNAAEVTGSYADRADDIRFLMDRFTALPASDVLAGMVNASRIGVSGHSFGALTSIRTSGLDTRVKAVVAQAPPGYTLSWIGVDRKLSEVGIPIMIESGGLDDTLPEAAHVGSLWREMARPRYWISISTAGHFTFSDLCLLDLKAIEAATNVGVGNVLEDGCGPMNIEHQLAYRTIRLYGIALFNQALRGSSGSAAFLTKDAAPAEAQPLLTVTAEP